MRAFPTDKLVIATHNHGKLEEMAALLPAGRFTLLTLDDLGLPVPEETAESFVGNARIKAHAAASASGHVALADDSGLAITALGGAPGVHTADWAETPQGRDFALAMARAHRELLDSGAPQPWAASFHSALVLAWPDGHDEVFTGTVPGHIVWPPRGDQGHGYDPIFQPEGQTVTFAEMDRWAKNRVSHRGRAMAALLAYFT